MECLEDDEISFRDPESQAESLEGYAKTRFI